MSIADHGQISERFRPIVDSLQRQRVELAKVDTAMRDFKRRALEKKGESHVINQDKPRLTPDEVKSHIDNLRYLSDYDGEVDINGATRETFQFALSEIASLQAKVDDLSRRLFPYADDAGICGISFGGFYLIGNKESIAEVKRLQNYEHRDKQARSNSALG